MDHPMSDIPDLENVQPDAEFLLDIRIKRILILFAATVNVVFSVISNNYLNLEDPLIIRILVSSVIFILLLLSFWIKWIEVYIELVVHILAILAAFELFHIIYLNNFSDMSILYFMIYLSIISLADSVIFNTQRILIGYIIMLNSGAVAITLIGDGKVGSKVLFLSLVSSITFMLYFASYQRIRNLEKLQKVDAIDKSLRRATSQLQSVVSNSPIVVWAIDKDGIFTLSEGKALADLNLIPGQVVGQPLFDLFQDYPDFVDANSEALKGRTMSIRSNVVGIFFDLHVAPIIDEDGTIQGAIGVGVNITEQIQIEEQLEETVKRYRNLFESVPFPIIVTKGGIIKVANKAFLDLFKYDKNQTPLEAPSLQIIAPMFHKQIEDRRARIRRGEIIPSSFETMGLKQSGEEFPIEINVSDIKYLGESAVLSFIEDITERQRIEETRLQTLRIESIALLAGGIAHDFNNMLMSIQGNIEIVKMLSHLEGEANKSIEDVQKTILLATNLTRQLLTFAKGGEPVRKSMAINSVVKDAVTLSLSGSQCTVEFDLSENLRPVEIDAAQITQVIQNIIINSVQSMTNGGTISVSTKLITSSALSKLHVKFSGNELDYIEIEIADQGTGIPVEIWDKIFNPYFTTKDEGYGLGLATSYSVITKHHGFIDFESSIGQGTKFVIYLPVSSVEPDQSIPSIVKHSGISFTGGRVLLMDDDEMILNSMSKILQILGFSVDTVVNGEDCLQMVYRSVEENLPYSFIILDLVIPGGLGGKETIRQIREKNIDIPAIVSSGYSNDPVVAEYAKYGFQNYLNKPYTIDQLKLAINRVLSDL